MDGLSNYELLDLKSIGRYEESHIIEALQDGCQIFEALCVMDEGLFNLNNVSHNEDDSFQAYKNYQMVLEGLLKFYEQL